MDFGKLVVIVVLVAVFVATLAGIAGYLSVFVGDWAQTSPWLAKPEGAHTAEFGMGTWIHFLDDVLGGGDNPGEGFLSTKLLIAAAAFVAIWILVWVLHALSRILGG